MQKDILGMNNPRVGCSILVEDEGREMCVRPLSHLMKANDQIQFGGNVEGRDVPWTGRFMFSLRRGFTGM